ncbi:hypothetical protein M5X00_26205 [Paenibacillus alvei]|uniref:hypothetical protein n=1 Tax=Paenibacillus alvei TaxID=44250 RepID=UPI00228259B8|nr:hypothetical protein [Paenibacillus alvei]MCY9757725.1 hypothetical protein [Paenibacillus alvei]
MSKFTVGAMVKVREGLKGGTDVGDIYFNDAMEKLCGETFEVATVTPSGYYYLKGQDWTFGEEMLEEVIPPVQSQVIEIDQTAKLEIYVEKVIVNDPATIMFYKTAIHDYTTGTFSHWSETKKVVAKVNKSVGDTFDVETGVNVAMLKAYRKEIDKLLRKA